MKRALATALCLLLLFTLPLFTAGCKEQETLRSVTLNEVTRSVFYAPLYAAISKGFFAQEGMEVEIVTGGGSDKSMTALLAGEADVALMGPETGVYVVNQGKEEHPMVVAQLTKRDGSFLLGRSMQEDFQWEDLRGKSIIAGRPGGMPCMTFEYLLKQHGLTPGEDVTLITNVQFPLMGGAFESGEGDYVTLFEPTASQFAAAGKGYILANIGEASGEVPYTAFMMRQETLTEEAEFAAAFVRAIYQAQQWVWSASDAEIAEAMLPFFPDADAASLAAVAKSYRETDSWTKDPIMTADAFTRLQDIMESAGELTARVELEELVENRFAEAAVQGE